MRITGVVPSDDMPTCGRLVRAPVASVGASFRRKRAPTSDNVWDQGVGAQGACRCHFWPATPNRQTGGPNAKVRPELVNPWGPIEDPREGVLKVEGDRHSKLGQLPLFLTWHTRVTILIVSGGYGNGHSRHAYGGLSRGTGVSRVGCAGVIRRRCRFFWVPLCGTYKGIRFGAFHTFEVGPCLLASGVRFRIWTWRLSKRSEIILRRLQPARA